MTWLVRMHADAKRYLCSTEPGYHATLSPASQHTMTLQGGLMSPEEVARHAAHPWLGDALRLRRWDDLAKVVGKATAPLAAWEPLLRSLLPVIHDPALPPPFAERFAPLDGGQVQRPALELSQLLRLRAPSRHRPPRPDLQRGTARCSRPS